MKKIIALSLGLCFLLVACTVPEPVVQKSTLDSSDVSSEEVEIDDALQDLDDLDNLDAEDIDFEELENLDFE